jgi:small redox-active disulfide protein 2
MKMKKIEVLGLGCPTCKNLLELVKKVVVDNGVEIEVIYITDIGEVMKRGIMSSPAVMIDGELKVSGRVPSEGEIRKWLEE